VLVLEGRQMIGVLIKGIEYVFEGKTCGKVCMHLKQYGTSVNFYLSN
jgi:hypothetical protein